MSSSIQDPLMSKSPPSELAGAIVPAGRLTAGQRDEMFALMDRYYRTSRPVFEADLAEKEQVILLTEPAAGRIRGFSTMLRLDLDSYSALFSGDTIIHEDFRYTTVLPRFWAELAFGLRDRIKAAEPARPVYWFLITSGYKTYRYLPVFFREFYPRHDRPTPPDMRRIMDTLAQTRYGEQYDAARGVIRLARGAPLREGVADIQPRHLRNPDIAFFDRANPGHVHGEELVCLAPIERENLTRAGRRMVEEGA